jgi:hypothetical protein
LDSELQLFVRRKRAKEVVSPGGELDAFAIEIVAFGKIEGFDEDALNVPDEAFRPRLELFLDRRDLLTDCAGH